MEQKKIDDGHSQVCGLCLNLSNDCVKIKDIDNKKDRFYCKICLMEYPGWKEKI